MANELTGNVHRIDTPGAGLIVTEDLVILTVRWVSSLAEAGDQVIIQDSNSKTVWESVADAPNYVEKDVVQEFTPGGYKVTVLDSGALYIRIQRKWEGGFGLR